MCGILGAVCREANNRMVDQWLTTGLSLLEKRGPDSGGSYIHKNVCLGARRLRVYDLSDRADQPMHSRDKNYQLVFNGAIFNYRQLRTELESLGHHFRTEGDTEVVLNALMQWGIEALPRFDGMFALAWHNRQANLLVLARDRFGIKPLYVFQSSEGILFSSEIKPLLAHPSVPRRVNEESLPEFVAFQMVTPPKTLFQGILCVRPGRSLSIQTSRPTEFEEKTYWQIDQSFLEQRDIPCFEDAIIESIERCWDADRSVSIQLSGGVDSSLITAISHDILNRKEISSFSVVFDDNTNRFAPPRSEAAYIEHVNHRYVKNPHISQFDPRDISPALPEAIWYNEVPLYSANTILYLLHAKEICQKTTVLLSGEGADDIYLGYFDGVDFNNDPDSLSQFYVKKDQLIGLFGAHGFKKAGANRRALLSKKRLDGMTLPQKASVLTVETVLHGLLARHDRMLMSQSIEGRPPFCSENMLRARFALPDNMVHSKKKGKIAVRKFAERFFNKDFVYRPKRWLAGPVSDWCANPLIWRGYVESVDTQVLGNYLNPNDFCETLDLPDTFEKWSGKNLALMFSLTNLSLWHKIFIEDQNPVSEEAWRSVVVN